MAGIYIHIPFCTHKCPYCNFFSVVSKRYAEGFENWLIREIDHRKEEINEPVSTIYFGGGTPSLLEVVQLKRLLDRIIDNFDVESDAEITLEANPENLSDSYFDRLRTTPVNRISLGVQSFNDQHLKWLERTHTAGKARDSIRALQDNGFDNFSIDLIYGLPVMTDQEWQRNLDLIREFHPPHFSAYALTVEPKTPLEVRIRKGLTPLPDDEAVTRHFRMLIEFCTSSDYEQYEISNFCRDRFYARHNTSYWRGEKYLGIGPSAHSFDGKIRKWNASSVSGYIKDVSEGRFYSGFEELGVNDRLNEYIMLSLRTQWGFDLEYVRKEFGDRAFYELQQGLEKYMQKGEVSIKSNGCYILSDTGKLYADGIAGSLFQTED